MCPLIESFRHWDVLVRVYGAGSLQELVEAQDPLVKDPLGSLKDWTAGVEVPVITVAFKVKVVPEGH